MTEKIIVVKEAKIGEKDGKDWAELTDVEGKLHRIFRSIQNSEGVWVHLDKEVDMLKAKIEDNSINGLGFKLIKEKKGTFWNVIAVEEVKDIFVKQAAEKVQDERGDSIEAQVAFKGMVELLIAGKLNEDETKATISWAMDRIALPYVIVTKIEEVKGETTKAQTIQETATTGHPETDVEVVENKPKTIAEFLNHLKGMGIKAPRTWLEKEGYIKTTEVLTLPKCQELYDIISEKEGS